RRAPLVISHWPAPPCLEAGRSLWAAEQWCSAWQPEQSWEALQMAVLEWAAPDGLEQAESRLEEWCLARQTAPLLVETWTREALQGWAFPRRLQARAWLFGE